jgi:hypothetical protein
MSEEVSLKEKEPADNGWTDSEIETFTRRTARFINDGMNEMNAEQLAQTMLNRDRPNSGDDRRICAECKGLKKGVCAFASKLGLRFDFQPVRTVLQRCDAFVLRGAA